MIDFLTGLPDWLLVAALFAVSAAAILASVLIAFHEPEHLVRPPAAALVPAVPAPRPEALTMPLDDNRPDPSDPTGQYVGMPAEFELAYVPRAFTRTGREVTLAEWLRRESGREDVWAEVVADFYRRAAAVPAVADYFGGVDWDRLQRHFLAALLIVTGRGTTVGTVRRIAAAHADVRNSAGRPITGDVYDAVIGTLVTILIEHRVPDATIAQLAAAVAPFRAVLVGDAATGRA